MTQPLIDSARLHLTGTSPESLDSVPAIGDVRPYTILAECVGHHEDKTAHNGIQKVVRLKILRLLPGVDKAIEDEPEAQPNLFDAMDEGEADDGSIEGPVFEGGPTFSGGDA